MRAGSCGRYYHTALYLGPLPSSRALQTVSVTLQPFAAGRRTLSVAAPSAFLPFPATVSPAILHSAEAVTAMQTATQMHNAPHAAPQAHGAAAPHAGRQLLSVAPMMDWTDTHYRQLARIISRRTWLWTEMVRTPALQRSTARQDYHTPSACSHPLSRPNLALTLSPLPPLPPYRCSPPGG